MAKNSIRDYSATNSSNTDIQSIDISEGCSPAGINNAIREVMADLKNVSTGTVALESPAFDSVTGNLNVNGTVTADGLDISGSSGATLTLTSTDTTGADTELLGQIDFVSSDASTGSAGTQARIKGVYEDNGDSSGIAFLTGASTGSGTPTLNEVMRIRHEGNVGIADTSPVSLLTVNKGNVTGAGQWASSAIAIANPTNIGAYSQISFGYTAASNASAYIGYVSTNQGANGYGDLVFGTRSVNTNTQPSERLRINSSGNLLVGTTTPNDTERLSVLTATDVAISTRVSSASNFYSLLIRNSSQSTIGSIYSTTTSTAFNTSSDYRLKENVVADWDATTRLKQLKPVRFNFIADADTTVDGFLAHEVQTVVPEAITGTKDAMRDEEYEVTPAVLDDDGNEVTPAVMGTRSVPDYQGIDQSKLTPLLTKALIEAVEKIEALEARITALEAE